MKYVINTRPGGFGLSVSTQICLHLQGSPAVRAEEAGVLHFPLEQFEAVPGHPGYRAHARYEMVLTPDGEFLSLPPCWDLSTRNCPLLVALVEEDAQAASGQYAELKVIEVPDDIAVHIASNDMGAEWVAEDHQTWH